MFKRNSFLFHFLSLEVMGKTWSNHQKSKWKKLYLGHPSSHLSFQLSDGSNIGCFAYISVHLSRIGHTEAVSVQKWRHISILIRYQYVTPPLNMIKSTKGCHKKVYLLWDISPKKGRGYWFLEFITNFVWKLQTCWKCQ